MLLFLYILQNTSPVELDFYPALTFPWGFYWPSDVKFHVKCENRMPHSWKYGEKMLFDY